MKIILLSGKAECGKSSVAKLAKERLEALGYKVVKLSYAQYVKDTAKMLFGWNGKKDEAGRALLQWWGTDKVRAKSANFWVVTVIRLAEIIRDMYDFAIIDDARFPNELNQWSAWDTYTVRVERPEHISALTPEQLSHPSETALDDYPFNIRLSARDWAELVEQVENVLMPELNPYAMAKQEEKETNQQ